MALEIMDAAAADDVRLILGVDETTLPDALILSPLVSGAAESTARAWMGAPTYAERPPDDQDVIRNAVIMLAAANALGTGPMIDANAITSERFGSQYTVSRSTEIKTPASWGVDLRARARQLLTPLNPTPESGPAVFTTPGPRRRRRLW